MTPRLRAFLFAAIAAGFFAPAMASAEDRPAAVVPPGGDKQYDFDTDTVEVDVLKPDMTMVEVLKNRARQSLIRIRTDFVKEIVRSAEDI